MENNWGPAPARTASERRLSPARSLVLDALTWAAEPIGLAALADATGLHANTVREHVEGLRERGLVERHRDTPSGRGRPGWLYAATGRSQDDPRPEYAGLATALVQVIRRTSDTPVEDARAAGVTWGRRLASESQHRPSGVRAARRLVGEMLDEMGFAPEAVGGPHDLRLTRCPLLEAARQDPDVVCSVHAGLAAGALAEFGVDGDVELAPFAERGACRLRLGSPR